MLRKINKRSVLYILLLLAILSCKSISTHAAEVIDKTGYLSRTQGTSMTLKYARLDTLLCNYKITLNLEPVNPGDPLEEVEMKYKSQINGTYEPFVLNAQNPTRVIYVNPSPELGNYSHDSEDTLYVWLVTNTSKMKVAVTISHESLGYSYVGGGYVNQYHGNITHASFETVVNDAGLYDYYIGYSLAMPSSGWLTNKYFINSVEKYSETFQYKSGNFGLIPIPNLKVGDVLKGDISMAAPGMGAGGISLYKKRSPFNISISSVYNKIGDNTPVVLNTNVTGLNGYYVEVFNTATGTVYDRRSCVNYPATLNVNVGSITGDFTVSARIVDSAGSEILRSSSVNINKTDSLSGLLKLLISTSGGSGVYIMVDDYRYFQNNPSNITLVSTISNTNKPIYFVGNLYTESKTLLGPLLRLS